jgi:hypothetical protein
MFAMMAPFQPAPPPSSPFDWGDEGRVGELLGGWFELELEQHTSTLRVPSGEAYWELFSTSSGPRRRSRSRSASAATSCGAHGSTSSSRATATARRSPTRASTCSCWANAAEKGSARDAQAGWPSASGCCAFKALRASSMVRRFTMCVASPSRTRIPMPKRMSTSIPLSTPVPRNLIAAKA